MIYIKLIVIFALFSQAFSSAIPIWELLSYHEKVGNLTFLFMRLVNTYCKKSNIPDCERVLTLYGVSNLLKADESTLDRLDPHHFNSRSELWRVAMNGGAFEYPYEKSLQFGVRNSQTEVENDLNTITNLSDMDYNFPNYYDYDGDVSEPHPYAVKVPPPPEFQHTTPKSVKNAPTASPTFKESSLITQTQLPASLGNDPNYIVLLPRGSRFDDGTSGRSQNSRFQDFRARSQPKEPRNLKKYNENSTKQPKKTLLFTVLRK